MNIADENFYPSPVQRIRETEYPHMKKGKANRLRPPERRHLKNKP